MASVVRPLSVSWSEVCEHNDVRYWVVTDATFVFSAVEESILDCFDAAVMEVTFFVSRYIDYDDKSVAGIFFNSLEDLVVDVIGLAIGEDGCSGQTDIFCEVAFSHIAFAFPEPVDLAWSYWAFEQRQDMLLPGLP